MSLNNHSKKEICEQIAKGNLDFYRMYLAANVQWTIVGEEQIVGKEAIIERAGMADLQAYPEVTIKRIIAEGDVMVVESTGEATLTNGVPYDQSYCDIYQFKDGMIAEYSTYLDTALSNNTSRDMLRDLVMQLNDAFGKTDVAFLTRHMTDEVEWQILGHPHLVRGKDEFISVCTSFPLRKGTAKVTVTNVIVEGNVAMAEIIIEAETMEGKPYRQIGCDVYHFRGDKFSRLISYFDTAYDLKILGRSFKF
jgi:uncharacterized protein